MLISAIMIIKDEHRSIAAAPYCMKYLVDAIRKGRTRLGFTAFRALIYYIDACAHRLSTAIRGPTRGMPPTVLIHKFVA